MLLQAKVTVSRGLKYSVIFLLVIFIVPKSLAWDISFQEDINQQCGQIYFQSSFQGQSLILKDDEQISSFTEILSQFQKSAQDQPANAEDSANESVATTDTVYSFRVAEGCKLKVSPLPYLKGNVYEFLGDVEEVTSDWLVPKSVACECPKLCRCEDAKLRKSECGRAYIKADCTECKATFTSLKTTHVDEGNNGNLEHVKWNDFPGLWSSHVTSIVLRKGCNVTMKFSKTDQPTRSNPSPIFSFSNSQVTHNVAASGSLTHYICQCKSDMVKENDDINPNEQYPPLITIPRTKGGINLLLSKMQDQDLKTHPGLISALQSLRSRRSSKNAYILLLGMTGSGKSSAVNLLFDHPNITKVGEYVSTTKDIIQFSIPVPIPTLGMNNTALHVIDTPGIGDTSGIAEDARYLASLDNFLSTQIDLRRSLPNAVLIFSKFTDNRFNGEGSPFVKMLRTIDLFKDRLIDKRSTNVIFVLTHYMSETKELRRDPTRRIAALRKVIQEHSTLPRPIHIVLAENKPEDAYLLNVNGYYQLTNGEFYPKNLFDQMQRNSINSGDPVGEAIIRTAFSNSDDFQIKGKTHPLLPPTNEKVTQYLGILGAFNTPVAETEVSLELRKAFDNVKPDLKAGYHEDLNLLQRRLYAKNTWVVNDLPKTSTDILTFLEEIQINPMTLLLLQNAFNLTIPEFPTGLLVGSGYSLMEDRVLPANIFQTDNGAVDSNDFPFKVPQFYKVMLDHGIDNQFQVFTNQEDFQAARMKSVGLSPQNINLKVDQENIKSVLKRDGFNLINLQDGNTSQHKVSWNSLTATVDYLTFQVSLNDAAAVLSENFMNAVSHLKPLNISDPINVQIWQQFFGKYGTHVVTNAFGGGHIKITAQVDKSSEESLTNGDKFAILSATLANITEKLGNELIGKDETYSPPPGVTYQFSQKGGNPKHFWANFSDLDEVKNVEAWRDSLKYEPILLTTRLQVVPISHIVKEFGTWEDESKESFEVMIEEAAANLLNASLLFIPIERISDGNPDSRDRTKMEESDYQKMQEFSVMFRTISEATQNAQMEMFKMMREMEQKKAAQDEQWQLKLQMMQDEQTKQERLLMEQELHEKQLKLKREQLESERLTQERLLREQKEEALRNLEMQQWVQMDEKRKRNEQNMLQFIIQENARRDEMARQKPGWLKVLGKISPLVAVINAFT